MTTAREAESKAVNTDVSVLLGPSSCQELLYPCTHQIIVKEPNIYLNITQKEPMAKVL